MRMRSVVPLLVGVLLIIGAIAATVWSVPYATTARSLHLFERETPTEVVDGSARQGVGLLGLDLVTLDDGRLVEVHRQGEPRVQWPRPAFLVGEHGARYADEAPAVGAWRPYALRAAAAWVAALLVLALSVPWVLRRLGPVLHQMGFAVFGQRDPGSGPVTWVPGAGGRGEGQVPPWVPHNPDWGKDRRIR